GRDLSPQDQQGTPLAFVVNQAFVKQYVPNGNPVGQLITFGDTLHFPIVGVVGDVRQGGVDEAIRTVDPQQTFTSAFTMDEAIGVAVARPRLLTVLLGIFGVIGLVLGA